MNDWRRLGQSRWLDLAALVLAVVGMLNLVSAVSGRSRCNDFAHYYLSSRLLGEGKNPYLAPWREEYARYGFVFEPDVATATNPPPLIWLLVPWARLPPRLAYAAWLVVQVVCLGAVLGLTRHLMRGSLSSRGWRFLCAGTLVSATLWWHFHYSQAQLLLAVMLLAALACQRQGKDTAAGLTVAAAGLLKLFPFILLPWFLWRGRGGVATRWRRAAVVLGVTALGGLATGPTLWSGFYHRALPSLAGCVVGNPVFNLSAFVINLGYAAHGFVPSAAAGRVWWQLGMAAGLVAIAAAYWWCWRCQRDDLLEFGLVTVAMLAGTVSAQNHYFVFLILPVGIAAARLATAPSRWRVWWLAVVLLLLNDLNSRTTPWLDRHLVLKVLANYTPVYGLVGLGWLLAGSLRLKKSSGSGTQETRVC